MLGPGAVCAGRYGLCKTQPPLVPGGSLEDRPEAYRALQSPVAVPASSTPEMLKSTTLAAVTLHLRRSPSSARPNGVRGP